MPSEIAKRAAGTYIVDSISKLPVTLTWLTQECREGMLAPHVQRFLHEQAEVLDQSLVVAEGFTGECIQCRIPCRCFDHEAAGTFDMDVRFDLNPQTGACRRREA